MRRLLLLTLVLASSYLFSQFSQIDLNPSDPDSKNLELVGDITFIGNGNLNRSTVKGQNDTYNYRKVKLTKPESLYFKVLGVWIKSSLTIDFRFEKTNDKTPNDSYDPKTEKFYRLFDAEKINFLGFKYDLYYSDKKTLVRRFGNNVNNGSMYMDNVNVDPLAGSEIFNSSMSTLKLPKCSKVVYAALYWGGIYAYDYWDKKIRKAGDGPWDTMKLKLPGATEYIDISASTPGGRVLRSINDPIVDPDRKNYICYKDVTSILQSLPESSLSNGEFYGANVHGTIGRSSDSGQSLGSSAGWTLVVIYENYDSGTPKYFSGFDGFEFVRKTQDKIVEYEGFKTIPDGPVNVKVLSATLEGDGGVSGDSFQILPDAKESATPNVNDFVNLRDPVNPSTNFFNGTYSIGGKYLTDRNPASTNSLGFDVDLVTMQNPDNKYIKNGDTKGVFRYSSTGDVYWPFLSMFAVEIIQPEVSIVKTINDGQEKDAQGRALFGSNNLANGEVDPGDTLFYDVCFENVGTDDATDTEVFDYMPQNVNLQESSTGIAPVYIDGVLNTANTKFDLMFSDAVVFDTSSGDSVDSDKVKFYSYETPKPNPSDPNKDNRGTITFKIGDNLMKFETPVKTCFRMKVQVVADCFSYRNLCSNEVDNFALATYKGLLSKFDNSDNPTTSFSGYEDCKLSVSQASNFLVNVVLCDTPRTENFCKGSSTVISAGTGYAEYKWTFNGSPLTTDLDGPVQLAQNSINVGTAGVYRVEKISPTDGSCVGFNETINLEEFDFTGNNPFTTLRDGFVTCSTDSSIELSEFYLCSSSSSNGKEIDLGFGVNADIKWFKLIPDSTTTPALPTENCPRNIAPTNWSWTEVNDFDGDSNTFTLKEEGEYRVLIQSKGCAQIYYFNVFKPDFEPKHNFYDILCGSDGLIEVSNVSPSYKILLEEATNPTELNDANLNWVVKENWAQFSGSSKDFAISDEGKYRYKIDFNSGVVSCPFVSEIISISNREISLDVSPKTSCYGASESQLDVKLSGASGSIKYYYALQSDSFPTTVPSVTSNTKSFTVDPTQEYKVKVEVLVTQNGFTNSCEKTIENIKFDMLSDIEFSAITKKNISCVDGDSPGLVSLSASGGIFPGGTAIYSYFVINPDGSETPVVFNNDGYYEVLKGNEGTLNFVVKTNKGCSKQATAKVDIEAPLTFTVVDNQPTCSVLGSIDVNIDANPNSYKLTYSAIAQNDANNTKANVATGNAVSITGLNPDDYIIEVLAESNDGLYSCLYTLNKVKIEEPASVTGATVTSSKDLTCSTPSLGAVTFTKPTQGSEPYTYSVELNSVVKSSTSSDPSVIISDLAAGVYTVYVTDKNSCKQDLGTIEIKDATVEPNFIASRVTYDCVGKASFSVTPFKSGYTYTLFEGNTQLKVSNDGNFSDIGPVTIDKVLNVKVGYGSGCVSKPINVTIESGKEFDASFGFANNIACHGESTGSLSIKVKNVSLPFYYSDSPTGKLTRVTSFTRIFTKLAPGTYTYYVYPTNDRSFCEKIITKTLIETDEIVVTTDFTPIKCDAVTGAYTKATVLPDAKGGSGTYTYEYSTSKTGPWSALVPLSAGEYYIKATDTKKCIGISDKFTIENPNNPIAAVIEPATDCSFGLLSDVKLELDFKGFTPSTYEYKVVGSTNAWKDLVLTSSSEALISDVGVVGNSIAFEVRDKVTGCVYQTNGITIPDNLSFDALPNKVTCTAGSFEIKDPKGGIPPYSYAVVPKGTVPVMSDYVSNTTIIPVQTTEINYGETKEFDIYIKDSSSNSGSGCTYFITKSIDRVDEITASITTVDPTCINDKGTVKLEIKGGTSTYSAQLYKDGVVDGASVSVNATGLYEFKNLDSDSNYKVEVKDASSTGCVIFTNELPINNGIDLNGAISSSPLPVPTCDLPQVDIEFTAPTNGSGSYLYTLTDVNDSTIFYSSSTTTVEDVLPGEYKVTITDTVKGCVQTLSANITLEELPTEPTFSVTPVSYSCEGKATFKVTPVDSNYTYFLYDGGTLITSNNTGEFLDIVNSNGVATTYDLVVDFGKTCKTKTKYPVTIELQKDFTVKSSIKQNVSCTNGVSNDGIITLTATNIASNGEFYYSLDNGVTFTTVIGTTTDINGLTVKNHQILVRYNKNSSDCEILLEENIVAITDDLTVTATATDIQCLTGKTTSTITASATGGDGSYSYLVGTSASGPFNLSLSGLNAGDYYVQVKDGKGCLAVSDKIEISTPETVSFDLVATECYDPDNSDHAVITIDNLVGNNNYSFELDGVSVSADEVTPNTKYEIKGLAPNTSGSSYAITVTDGFGCSQTKSVTVNPKITFDVEVNSVSNCTAGKGGITVTNVKGGTGTYEYAFIEGSIAPTSYVASNIFDIVYADFPAGVLEKDITVYVKDQNTNCVVSLVKKVVKVEPIEYPTSIDLTHPSCSASDSGFVEVIFPQDLNDQVVTIENTSTATTHTGVKLSNNKYLFSDLIAGEYKLSVTDTNCTYEFTTSTELIKLNDAPDLSSVSYQFDTAKDCAPYVGNEDFFKIFLTKSNTVPPNAPVVLTPSDYAPYKLQLSIDGGGTWSDFDQIEIKRIVPKTLLDINFRLVDDTNNNNSFDTADKVVCYYDLGNDEMPESVIGLVVDYIVEPSCTDGVTAKLTASEGVPGFQFSKDGGNTWEPSTLQASRDYTFSNLIPGRQYVFKVKDSKGCERENSTPIDYSSAIDIDIDVRAFDACFGTNLGGVEYTITDSKGILSGNVDWEIYEDNNGVASSSPVKSGSISSFPSGGAPYVLRKNKIGQLPKSKTYFLVLTSSSGCKYASKNATISENLSQITAQIGTIEPITCTKAGSVELINVQGGKPPYEITSASAINTIRYPKTDGYKIIVEYDDVAIKTNPYVQVYFQVRDVNQCLIASTFTAQIPIVQQPEIATVVANSCTTAKDVTVTLDSSVPGQAPYTYSISKDGVNFTDTNNISSTSHTFTPLTPGNYYVKVKDANGCETNVSTATQVYESINFNVVQSSATCKPNESAITISNITGGSGNFDYEITGKVSKVNVPSTTSFDVTSLDKGTTYDIVITDNTTGCSKTKQITTTEPSKPTFSSQITKEAKCLGDDIEILLNNSSLTYSTSVKTNTSGLSDPSVVVTGDKLAISRTDSSNSSLDVTYTVRGVDAKGCFNEIDLSVNFPSEIGLPELETSLNGCGDVEFSWDDVSKLIGGSGNYTKAELYNTSNLTTPVEVITSNINATTALFKINSTTEFGDFNVVVYDDNGCKQTSNTVTINQFDLITQMNVNINQINDCNGVELVTFSYVPASATGYTVSVFYVDGSSTEQPLPSSNINSGVYTLNESLSKDYVFKMTSTSGCEYTKNYQMTPQKNYLLKTVTTDVTCKGDSDGVVKYSFVGTDIYTGTYNYTVYDSTGSSTGKTGDHTDANFETTGLKAGKYKVQINLDNYGNCPLIKEFEIFEPTNPINLDVSITNVVCNGEANGKLSFLATQGRGDFNYQIEKVDDNLGTNIISVVQAYGANTSLSNLTSGFYKVLAKDKSNCIISKIVEITQPDIVGASSITVDNKVCSDNDPATIKVNSPSGGSGTYFYSLFDASGTEVVVKQKSNVFEVRTPGTYSVKVFDTNNCDSGNLLAPVELKEKLEVVVNETLNVTCSQNGKAEVEITGGSGTFNVTVTDSNGVGVITTAIATNKYSFDTDFNQNGLVYQIEVNDTDVVPNCVVSKSLTIRDTTAPVFNEIVTPSKCASDTFTITLDNPDLEYSITLDSNTSGSVNTPVVVDNVITLTSSDTSSEVSHKYTVTGKDKVTDCTTTLDIDVLIPALITVPNLTITQFACNANSNSSASAVIKLDGSSINGGSKNYTKAELYKVDSSADELIDAVEFASAIEFELSDNTQSGDFYIKVYDDNNCTANSSPVTLNPFETIKSLDITVLSPRDCNGDERLKVDYLPSSATLTVLDASNGTVLPVSGTTNEFVVNAADGDFTFTISNNVGCVISKTHTVSAEPVYELVEVSRVDPLCNTDFASITFELTDNTYTGGVTYDVYEASDVTASTPITTITKTGLTIGNIVPGDYYIKATIDDYPYCNVEQKSFSVAKPSVIDLNILSTTIVSELKCNEPSSGSISINVEGGVPPYKYYVENTTSATVYSNYGSSKILNDLEQGDYIVRVKDSKGCEVTTSSAAIAFTLNVPSNINASTNIIENDCEGEQVASIEVLTPTGATDYLYKIEYPNGDISLAQSSNRFDNLEANNQGESYTIHVLDAKGYACPYEEQVTIVDPSKVTATFRYTSAFTCDNQDVSIEVNVTGGDSSSYSFSVNGLGYTPASPSSVFSTSLTPSDVPYIISFKDAKGCLGQIPVEIPVGTPLATYAEKIQDVTCNGSSNGMIRASQNGGGFGNYQYQLLDSSGTVVRSAQDSPDFDNLPAGAYIVKTLSEGCEADSSTITITEPDVLDLVYISQTNETCQGSNDGTVIVKATGGVPSDSGYDYYLSTDPVGRYRKSGEIKDLAPGDYSVYVYDSYSCETTKVDFKILPAEPIELSIIERVEQICIDDLSPSFTIKVHRGTGPYFTSINNLDNFVQHTSDRIVFDSSRGITTGEDYIIYVKDSRCDVPKEIKVSRFTAPVNMSVDVSLAYTCDDVAEITSLATVNSPYSKQKIFYTLYAAQGQTGANPIKVETNNTGNFENLPEGWYFVQTTYQGTQCFKNSNVVKVEELQPLVFSVDSTQKNKFIVSAFGGISPYQYSFDGGLTFTDSNEHTIVYTAEYDIVVKDSRQKTDEQGCSVNEIHEGVYESLVLPNFFTPDGDGKNDYWYPYELEDYHDVRIEIYDRYGRTVASFTGKDEQGWDGTYCGKPLPRGDYWYTIFYKELSGEEKKIMGHFTLYRKD